MAEVNGGFLLRVEFSADLFKDEAIRFGSFQVNTPSSKSKASLFLVTSLDQYFLFTMIKDKEILFPQRLKGKSTCRSGRFGRVFVKMRRLQHLCNVVASPQTFLFSHANVLHWSKKKSSVRMSFKRVGLAERIFGRFGRKFKAL